LLILLHIYIVLNLLCLLTISTKHKLEVSIYHIPVLLSGYIRFAHFALTDIDNLELTMPSTSINFLGWASIPISAPTTETDSLIAYNEIDRCHPVQDNCTLNNYPKIGKRAILAGIRIWKGDGAS
jgi:hypothetical protein